MKKLLVIMLCLAMVFAFAACTPDTPDVDPNTDVDPNANVDSDLAYVQDKGELVIGMTIFEPMNYEDENGDLTGFDTELAEAVCAKLGVTAKFLEIVWDSKEMELTSKQIDCIWNGMTIKEELKANIDFSVPYVENRQVAVIDSANADKYVDIASIADARIVAEAQSAGEAAIGMEEALSSANFTPVDKQSTAVLEVKMGSADVAVFDYVMARATLKGDFANLMIVPDVIVGGEDALEEYGIGFRKGSDLVAAVNQALEELAADGTVATLAEKYGLTDLMILGAE